MPTRLRCSFTMPAAARYNRCPMRPPRDDTCRARSPFGPAGRARKASARNYSESRPVRAGRALLLLRRLERFLDLLANVAVVLRQQLLFFFGQDAERHAHDGLGELHVEPVLAVLDAAGHAEEEAAHAGTQVTELHVVPRPRAVVELGEE